MWFDEEYKSGIMLENFSLLFPDDERVQIKKLLNEQSIGVLFVETRGVQASFIEAASIYINEHLTELILTGLIAPAAYDAIKIAISAVIGKIKSWFRPPKRDSPVVCLKFKTANAEIIAPIPDYLSNEQFKIYMDTLRETLEHDSKPKIEKVTRFEYFIVEENCDKTHIVTKTIAEYSYEQRRKKENEQ